LSRQPPTVDRQLPEYAQGGTSFEFARSGLDRGHMAPDDLMESWGIGAVREAMRMSNMVPQLKGRNHAVWTVLEHEIRDVVADDEDEVEIDSVWTIAGPVFREGSRDRRVGNPGTRVPDATYKVVAWHSAGDSLGMRAYVIEQRATNVDLSQYLVPVDTVEELTGLDFFSELADEQEESLESADATSLWE
jgi:endonuclease G